MLVIARANPVKVEAVDESAFRGLAMALRALALPPTDAGFEDLLAKLEAAPGLSETPDKAQRTLAFEPNFGRDCDRG
jgi:hypothetical protein